MDPPPPQAQAYFTPFITCANCEVDVPMHLLGSHVCSKMTAAPLVEEPEQLPMPTIETPPAQPAERRPPRPFVPHIDPFAASKMSISGELTPVSSGPGSATASPISPSGRSPFLHPPRKASVPLPRRPPSPELISQDCAFPPFPTSKTKKKDQPRPPIRGRTQTPDSTKSFENDRLRSTSVGAQKSRLRQGTGDSSRPSTASSSRQPSISSRSGSRQGSIDVPPLPTLQPTTSHPASDPGAEATSPGQPTTWPLPPEPSPLHESVSSSDSTTFPPLAVQRSNTELPPNTTLFPPRKSSTQPDLSQPLDHSTTSAMQEPSYKSKRPPPITNMPSSLLGDHGPKAAIVVPAHPPPTPTSTLTRTLTSLFGRKRAPSKGQAKAPATDGPRFEALSPDPDPQEAYLRDNSAHSSMTTDMLPTPPMHGGIQEVPRSSMDVQVTQHDQVIPEPSSGHIAHHSDTDDESEDEVELGDDHQDSKATARDTLQMEEDLEKRLAAMGAPRLSVVNEAGEDNNRASVDSASSYGSVDYSRGSVSSRSMHVFDGHSQGSSISTARTAISTDDAFTTPFPKFREAEAPPDSPTDPYLQHGRLAPVPEVIAPAQDNKEDHFDNYFERNKMLTPVPEVVSSPEAEKEDSIATYMIPVPPTPSSELDKFDFPDPPRQRRPSTPGGFKGICRGCSKRILSGQKSVSSKDGRLTGRYHKECFVCVTCREPFATADFYVHDDHPYCAHDYHTLNETLCEGCGKGIEGVFLETSTVSGNVSKKFHPDCLRCATCKVQLHEDYFELSGKVYCEKDAFRMASGPRSPYDTAPSRPSPLNREYVASGMAGQALTQGKFPERRLTKLMTMS